MYGDSGGQIIGIMQKMQKYKKIVDKLLRHETLDFGEIEFLKKQGHQLPN